LENRHNGVGRWPSRQQSISSGWKAYFLEEGKVLEIWQKVCEKLFAIHFDGDLSAKDKAPQ
jgi:hypothetical protein